MKTPEEIAAEVFSADKELRHKALHYIIENFPPHGNLHTLRALQLCFIAGNKAGDESLRYQLQSLESQLRQANGMVMKLEAE